MTAPDIMSTITASLKNFSLNHHHNSSSSSSVSSRGESSESSSDDTTLEVNSHVSLPYHWEQCLDLKTGEICYINWRNGITTKEDPMKIQENGNAIFYSKEEEEEDSSYASDESSSDSSPSPSKDLNQRRILDREEDVLVVVGCKRCYMYLMVPKRLQGCPRCNSHLIHFDGSQNGLP